MRISSKIVIKVFFFDRDSSFPFWQISFQIVSKSEIQIFIRGFVSGERGQTQNKLGAISAYEF